jgi:hypothetical protein
MPFSAPCVLFFPLVLFILFMPLVLFMLSALIPYA